MAVRRGNRHEVTIDGQTIWLDSNTEEIALRYFIEELGFSGKWLRPVFGIKHAGKFYSPDFELSINYYGQPARALVEVKQTRQDFTRNIAERMFAVAAHYKTDCLLLYVVKSDKWYRVFSKRGLVRPCPSPQPGPTALTQLAQPKRSVVRNYYGRRYYQSFGDKFLSVIRDLLNPPKRKRRR